MLHKSRANGVTNRQQKWLKLSWKVALPGILIVTFVLQVSIVLSLVGYLSYRSGQQAVQDLTDRLITNSSQRVTDKLTNSLATAQLANQLNSKAVLRGDLLLDLGQTKVQRQYLEQQLQTFDQLTEMNLVATPSGDYLGFWRPEPHTILGITKSAIDARTDPGYQQVIATKKTAWNIYPDRNLGSVVIAASQPLFEPNGRLGGVSTSHISLANIQVFLAQNPVSSTGQAFVIEKQSGLLVASSSSEQPVRLAADQSTQRLLATESHTPVIKTATQALQQQVGKLANIQKSQKFQWAIDQKLQFAQVVPFKPQPGLDWLVVVVVPESDMMVKINAGSRSTLWWCLAASLGIIALNVLISRWLAKPFKSLKKAFQKMVRGDFDYQIKTASLRELLMLATSVSSSQMNQMSKEIQRSRAQLEEYSKSLEQKVNDRTQALQQEVEQRQQAEAALQAANQELQNLAYLDGMTRIANRRRFDEQLQQEWFRMKRLQLPLSLILCDVDYFKQYNDTYGHQVGDECLCHIARALTAAARRSSDLVARYGGEEFVMLLPNTSLAGAREVASMIRLNIQNLQLQHRNSEVGAYVTASYGVASMIPDEHNDPAQLLLRVDKALYFAKRSGRDRIADS